MQEVELNLLLLVTIIISAIVLKTPLPHKKTIVLILFSAFLAIAPPTASDQDFEAYKSGFENIEFVYEYPFVISNTNLTAERGFFWYMVIFHVLTNQFNIFLILNFLLLSFLNGSLLKKLGFSKGNLTTIMLYALPAFVPLIFYWSPRSGPSISLILIAYILFLKKKYIFSFGAFFLASMLHSQYIPFITVITLTLSINKLMNRNLLVSALLFSIATIGLLKYGTDFIRLIPSGDIFAVAFAKLHYIDELGESAGIRLSGLILIFIDFLYLTVIRNKIRTKYPITIINLVDICIVFSLVTNLLFINDSHVSGRVARFADFFIIICATPYFISIFAKRNFTPVFHAFSFLILLIMYKNIYYIESMQ